VFNWIPENERFSGQLLAGHVSGRDSARKRVQKLASLAAATPERRVVMANARCLTEGIDVPSVGFVAFIDPKTSLIDIVQATGRATRRAPGKEVAYVLAPLFISPEEDVDEAIDESAYQVLGKVLRALGAYDAELAERINVYRRGLGKQKKGKGTQKNAAPPFEILPSSIGQDFIQALTVRVVELASASFEEWFGVLEDYKHEFGRANPPAVVGRGGPTFLYHGYAIGRWANNLRSRKQILSDDRIRRLDEIGFVWTPRDERWEKMFSQRQANPTGKSTDHWVKTQRIAKKEDKLESSRIQRLEAAGFSWDPLDDEFKNTVQRFVQYYKVSGHIPAPKYRDGDEYPLGQRTVTIRDSYRSGTLRPEWIDILNNTKGWTFDPYADDFEKTIQAIKDHVQEHGRLPKAGDDLDVAVKSLRGNKTRNGQKGGLRPEQVNRLEKEIPGWSWDPLADWFEQNLKETKEFVQQHGRLPRRSENKPGRWLGHLREKKNKLGVERRSRLDQEIPGWEA
jgi:Helicase associated domain/Helicase conserved C-terminal domain